MESLVSAAVSHSVSSRLTSGARACPAQQHRLASGIAPFKHLDHFHIKEKLVAKVVEILESVSRFLHEVSEGEFRVVEPFVPTEAACTESTDVGFSGPNKAPSLSAVKV